MNKIIPLKAHQDATAALFHNISLTIHQRLDTWDFASGQDTVDQLIKFLRKHRNELGDISFGLEITQADDPKKSPLTPKYITTANAQEASLITLDSKLRVLKTSKLNCGAVVHEHVLSEASSNTVIAHYESRSLLRFYANCSTARCVNLDEPTSLPGRPTRLRYSADEFRLAMRDHYRLQVKYCQGTDHWIDRKKRILYSRLGSCSKTEDIFHRSLVLWLEMHLDGDVKSKTQDSTKDEPDIQITALGGRIFLIEVKWLGRNQKTTHDLEWLKKSIRQIEQYLIKRPSATSATAAIYDAREKEKYEELKHIREMEDGCRSLEECDGVCVPARGDCMVFFLENKSASES